MARITSDLFDVTEFAHHCPEEIFIAGLKIIVSFIILCGINIPLTLIMFASLPVIFIIVKFFNTRMRSAFKEQRNQVGEINSQVEDTLLGIRVVKSFVREDYEKKNFDRINKEVLEMNVRSQKLMLYMTPAIMLIIYGCMVFALWRGTGLIIEGNTNLTPGKMTTFISYITQVISSVMTVLLVFMSMIMAKASIGRIGEVFAEEPAINDHGNDETLKLSDGSIEYRNVSFSYSADAVKNVLSDINLTVNSGETVGIIGATGSAKSTLIQLIPRLYDPTEGEVLVGGRNVKEYTFENLRNEIAVVLQQNMLFSGTIKENIRWGDFDATDEQIEDAARDAQAHDFISEFEKGYDTELGQGGNTVSGGQRQRICIARALLKKPKILIFDDSTSAVDTATDSKIRMALRSEKYAGITKIIIAQRITSIMDADRIVVIDDGRIIGTGTHDELTKSNEVYNEIFVSQQEGVLAQ